MEFCIDNRENSLIPILQEGLSSYEDKITVSVIPLQIGDFSIKYNGEEVIIFERKSLTDLAASIKDGRYREQSLRLSASNIPNHNIIYIVEGSEQHSIGYGKSMPYTTLLGAIVSLNYFKGFSVLRTNNIHETAQLLLKFVNKLFKEKDKLGFYSIPVHKEGNDDIDKIEVTIPSGTAVADYTQVIKTEKKANITPDNIVIVMISQIPGISSKTAKSIATKYSTVAALTDACKEGVAAFDDIRITGTGRRLAQTCKANIVRYVMGRNEMVEMEIE